jgi:hypothetical protein
VIKLVSADSPRPSATSRVSLVAVLAAVAFVELVLNRVLGRLLHLEFLQPRSPGMRVFDDLSYFSFQLLSVAAVLLFAAGIARVAIVGKEFRSGARASLPLVGAVFLVLAALGVVVRLPQNLVFHLQLSFLFVLLLLLLSTVASPATLRVKLGTVFLFLGIALRLAPQMAFRLNVFEEPSPLVRDLLQVSSLSAIAAGTLLFVPRRRSTRLAPILTWLVVCGAALLIRRDWETAARVAAYGFGLELPIQPWGQLIILATLAATLYATVRLLVVPGTHRLRGFGVVLLFLAGLELSAPGQLAVAALGFLCLAASAVRVDGAPLTREAFERLVKSGAAALGAQQVTITGTTGDEVARLHSPADAGKPITVVLSRRSSTLREVEVTVGETPPRDPPFTVEHGAAPRLGPRASGARVETGEAAFDAAFDVHDQRSAGTSLLDDATRAQLTSHLRGWLGVWPQRGVRYRAAELATLTDDELPSLIALLKDLATKTA